MMEQIVTWTIISALGLGVAGVLALRQRWADARLPPVMTIAAAKPGQVVRIVGTIVEGGTVHAPITGRACVCFSAAVYPLILQRSDEGGVVRVRAHAPFERVGAADFIVEDGTDRIAVEAGGLLIRADLDHRKEVPGNTKLHDPSFVVTPINYEELQLDEGIITIGAHVVLEGVVQRGSGGPADAAFRTDVSTAARLVPSKEQPASVTNLPVLLAKAGWKAPAQRWLAGSSRHTSGLERPRR
jgi:hypothetical protein